MRYSEERKEAVLRKLLPPLSRTIADVAQEEGISGATLYNWRKEARRRGRLLPDADLTPDGWTSKDKFAAVLETASLNESELAESCRKRGLYPEQIRAWRTACESANDWEQAAGRRLSEAMRGERKRNRQLEHKLKRKERALAEAAAFWQVVNYREAYGLYACAGILFNHESPLRPERFVTQKIVRAACRIAAGKQKTLTLGNLSIQRDWGWAPEYVEAMWRMLQQKRPEDYVIATGETRSLEDFVAEAFRLVGLDWREHVESDPTLLRPTDLRIGRANPAKVHERLGWSAKSRMPDVVRQMIAAAKMQSYG